MAFASAMKKSSVRARWRGRRTVMLVGSWHKPLSIVVKSCHSGRRSVRSQPLCTNTTIRSGAHYTLNEPGFIITHTVFELCGGLMFPLALGRCPFASDSTGPALHFSISWWRWCNCVQTPWKSCKSPWHVTLLPWEQLRQKATVRCIMQKLCQSGCSPIQKTWMNEPQLM